VQYMPSLLKEPSTLPQKSIILLGLCYCGAIFISKRSQWGYSVFKISHSEVNTLGGLSKVATIVTRAVKLAKQCAGAVSSDDDIGPLPPILDATLLELDSMLDIVQRRARIWHLLTSMSDVCRIFFQRINCNNKVGLDPEMF